MNKIEKLEKDQIAALTEGREIPEFGPGDTLRVDVRIVEGTRERIQAFEGVCIARKNAGVNSAFTVRKISYGEGVERIFPLYAPQIDKITVIRRGDVRRAKLYYLRGRRGKSARIAEKQDFHRKDKAAKKATPKTVKAKDDGKKPAKAAAAKKPAAKKKTSKAKAKKD